MLLAVDIGNTNVVLGIFEGQSLRFRWRMDSQARRSEDEWTVLIQTLLRNVNLDFSNITGMAISSVVPGITPVFAAIFKNRSDIKPVLISDNLNIGLTIKYDDPASVGADRLCNTIAGYEMYGGPLIIIDFGTATTYDIISNSGEYLGGIIAPGLESAALHLHKIAAKLPSVELKFPENIIATNTERSIQVGIMYGAVASIEGIVARIKNELNEDTQVIATGGLAEMIIEKTSVIQHHEPDLTLIGIEKIFRKIKIN